MLAGGLFPADCAVTLRRNCVFLVIEVSTRPGHVPGVAGRTAGPWTVRQARTLLNPGEQAARFVIRGRAGQFTKAPGAVLPAAGMSPSAWWRRCRS
jgi:hypothetical protein